MIDPSGPVHEWEVLLLATGALISMVGVWIRWGLPRVKARWERDRDWSVLVDGRPAIPANPRTGTPEQPAVPPIAVLVAQVAAQIREIHHELHPNGGSSMKDAQQRIETVVQAMALRLEQGDAAFADITTRLGRIESQLDGEVHVANRALDNAAEASKTALDTIHAAILADPPADLS
ncbi:hypothetical protein GCM10022215_29640 [Nocardioides fonticola]|uniref:Uncharacterized protein n=1 Tax=Nocardioides fonticola TaxID=450363 RepID=A0ABP7XPA8_9ACTN